MPYLLFAQAATTATISYTMSWMNPGIHLAANENTFLSFVSDVPFRLVYVLIPLFLAFQVSAPGLNAKNPPLTMNRVDRNLSIAARSLPFRV